jgi:hypothetical protein
MDEYRSGLYPITADMFPSFLYDNAIKDFDPKNPLVNMFNSRFFIRVKSSSYSPVRSDFPSVLQSRFEREWNSL